MIDDQLVESERIRDTQLLLDFRQYLEKRFVRGWRRRFTRRDRSWSCPERSLSGPDRSLIDH